MLSQTILTAMNNQIKYEFQAAFLYLSIAAYLESLDLPGAAAAMRQQSDEEMEHAMKFFNYITDRNSRVTLQALEQPQTDFASPLAAFEGALAHELQVTGLINNIYAAAVQEKDFASQQFLDWFVSEQVEEEKTASLRVTRWAMAEGHPGATLMLDHEMEEGSEGGAE